MILTHVHLRVPQSKLKKEEARASHDAARVPTPDTPLRVLPKRSRRVREVHPRQGQKMNLFQVNNVMHLT